MENVLGQLGGEQTMAGDTAVFAALQPFLSREPEPGEYAAISARLDVAPGTLAVRVHRLRGRYRQLVRAAVADTVDSPLEVEAEMRHLLAVLQGS